MVGPRLPSLPSASYLELTVGREGEWMWRSHIIRQRESLVLYKSFNTLCLPPTPYLTRCSIDSPNLTLSRMLVGNGRGGGDQLGPTASNKLIKGFGYFYTLE